MPPCSPPLWCVANYKHRLHVYSTFFLALHNALFVLYWGVLRQGCGLKRILSRHTYLSPSEDVPVIRWMSVL